LAMMGCTRNNRNDDSRIVSAGASIGLLFRFYSRRL
jgi:hypothetical protein